MITEHPSDIFRAHISTNLQYWQGYVAVKLSDVAALDRGCDRIIMAILFALKHQENWPSIRDFIVTFSPYMKRKGYWEIWHGVLSQALVTARQVEDWAGLAMLSVFRAQLLQRQSRPKQAIADYRRVIGLARQIGDRYTEARVCSNLGYLYTEMGYWWRAELLCCHALAIFEQIDSNHGRAHTENHLGILYTRRGRWPQAEAHLERACDLWERMGDDYGLMYGFINLGLLFTDTAYPDKAIPILEKALNLAQLTGDENHLGKTYNNLSIAYRLKSDFITAEMYVWRAEAIFQRFADKNGLAEIWESLGLICLDQGKWPEAIVYFELALQAWRDLANRYGEARALTYLAQCQQAPGS